MGFSTVGPCQTHTRVAVDSTASFSKGDIVVVSSGEVTAASGADTQGLAMSLQDFPDNEYEGTQSDVDIVVVGDGEEFKVTWSGTTATATWVGSTFALGTADPQTLDFAATTGTVFTVTRFDEGSSGGDTTGALVGVFNDAAAFGGN